MHEGAVEQFRQAIEVNPYYDQAFQVLGRALVRLDRMDEAQEAFERFRILEPVGQRILFLRQSIANTPGSVTLLLDLATELIQVGDIDAGIEQLEKGVALDPEFVDTYYRLGGAHLQKGDPARAAELYFEAGDHADLVHVHGRDFVALLAAAKHGAISRVS